MGGLFTDEANAPVHGLATAATYERFMEVGLHRTNMLPITYDFEITQPFKVARVVGDDSRYAGAVKCGAEHGIE